MHVLRIRFLRSKFDSEIFQLREQLTDARLILNS